MCTCTCVCVWEAQTGNRRNSTFQRNPWTGSGEGGWQRKVQIKPHSRELCTAQTKNVNYNKTLYIPPFEFGFFLVFNAYAICLPGKYRRGVVLLLFFFSPPYKTCLQSVMKLFFLSCGKGRTNFLRDVRSQYVCVCVCVYIYNRIPFYCFELLNSFSCWHFFRLFAGFLFKRNDRRLKVGYLKTYTFLACIHTYRTHARVMFCFCFCFFFIRPMRTITTMFITTLIWTIFVNDVSTRPNKIYNYCSTFVIVNSVIVIVPD